MASAASRRFLPLAALRPASLPPGELLVWAVVDLWLLPTIDQKVA
jgi:hypothetical protein